MAKRKIDRDWLGMESRMRSILDDASKDLDWETATHRLDACLAAFTCRGHALADMDKHKVLVEAEWNYAEFREMT